MNKSIAIIIFLGILVILAFMFIWNINFEQGKEISREKTGLGRDVEQQEPTKYEENHNNASLYGNIFKKKECTEGDVKFDYAPVNLNKTEMFLPMGLMVGSHVTPIDHHYFQSFGDEEVNIEIYSPGEGYVTEIGQMEGAHLAEDYRVVIEHSCTLSSIYIHVAILADKLKGYIEGKDYASVRIPVKAGELIGYFNKNVDYNLVDEAIVLPGFVVPEHYEAEPWKIHVPDTYAYFNEPVRSQLIAKSVRTVEPISGKIDYDIDGKLVGNWFLEGTNGYAGESSIKGRYWIGHLSFVYDAYDPKRIVLSIGGYNGTDSKQFTVKNNSPNPADVGIEDGLVKYELVSYSHVKPDGIVWDHKSYTKNLKTVPEDLIEGVVLVQLFEDRKIRFETFPRKNASDVHNFTRNAQIYER